MKQRLIQLLVCFIIFSFLGGFYYINQKNYLKIKEIQYNITQHPELLPQKEFAKYASFGFSNLRADIYWLEAIQYIGSNAIGSEYKKYLYTMLDLITELNPFFEKPYIIGQLLLPSYNERYETLSAEEQENNKKQAEEIGLKGIQNFCDSTKIEKIKKENNLEKIWTEQEYKNPCKTSDIAFGQGFLYYFYLKNPLEAANYYKIASANDDALEGARIMAAIMNGKGGDREKSILMFLTLADKEKEDESCSIFSKELQQVSYNTFMEGIPLSGEIIKNIEDLRKQYFTFDEEAEKQIIAGNNCNNYINKAIRELNLAYIEQANKKYFSEKGINAKNAKILYDEGYLDFLPTDFQQYGEYGIIYIFNEDTQNFDYEIGNY
ncbi:MAG: hypothetical protein AB7E37_02415 [Candidatus Altimarinota bacterium]